MKGLGATTLRYGYKGRLTFARHKAGVSDGPMSHIDEIADGMAIVMSWSEFGLFSAVRAVGASVLSRAYRLETLCKAD